jgi:hypothetical protein
MFLEYNCIILSFYWPQNILEQELEGLHEDVLLKFLVNTTTTTITFVGVGH